MTLKEAMQILLDVSRCQWCYCKKCNAEVCHRKVLEAQRLVEIYLAPAEPSMEE